jgi:hypothetical protein
MYGNSRKLAKEQVKGDGSEDKGQRLKVKGQRSRFRL